MVKLRHISPHAVKATKYIYFLLYIDCRALIRLILILLCYNIKATFSHQYLYLPV